MEQNLPLGFCMILIAAVSGGAFGLQYTIMRKYTVENASLLSLFFATVIVPFFAVTLLLPGWSQALADVGFTTCFIVFAFGFGWGLGAITYAFAFNLLGMALAAAIIKGLTIAIGSGVPLLRNWDQVSVAAKTFTILGIGVLLVGTTVCGRAGILREREIQQKQRSPHAPPPKASKFLLGFLMALLSGVLSAFVNLGYDFGNGLEHAMQKVAGMDLTWKATLIRWMPMYWGGITALLLVMGGRMLRSGAWRNYFAPGSGRDLAVASSMGVMHFFAQIPYGVGAFYLGTLGTSVGWGANIGMALVVAATIGFLTGEWNGVSRRTLRLLLAGIGVLLAALGVLAYANSLQ